MYTDCTRLDEALKKGEAIHAKDTESSLKTNSDQKTAEHSSNESADTLGTNWSSCDDFTGYSGYDYGQAWNSSQHYQTEECGSTKDPYRENLASKTETPSDSSWTNYRQSYEPLSFIDRSSSEFVPTSKG